MIGIFRFRTTAVVTLAFLVAVGCMGGVAVADDDDLDDEISDRVEAIMDRTDPENADAGELAIVQEWATDEQLDQLDDRDRDRVESWLEAATGGDRADDPDDQDQLTGINASEVEQTIDSQTAIMDWTYSDGMFTVEFYAEEPTTLTVAESGSFEEGTGEFAYYSRPLPAGESVETFRVVHQDGAALTMATPLAQEEERGAYISTGGEAEDPFRHFGGHSGLFSGVAMTVLLAAVGAAIVIWQEETGVVKA